MSAETRIATSRWPVVVAFALVGAATQLLWLTFAPITSDAAKHFHVSESAIGWLANVFPLLYVLLAIPAGVALDRWFRSALIAGAVLTAVGALIRLAGGYDALLFGQVLVAVAQPLVLNAITGVAARYLAPQDRASGIAAGTASTFAGMVIAFAVGAALPEHALLIVDAVFASAAALVLASALRAPVGFAPATVGLGWQDTLAAVRTTWRDPFLRRVCVLVMIPFGTFVALATWTQALLEPAGVSKDAAGVVLVANVLAGVAGSALVPVWAARHRRELWVMRVAVLVTAASCALLAAVPSLALALIVFSVFGFLLLPALPIVLELSERHGEAAASTAAGLIWLAGNFGGLIVAAAVGVIVHHPVPAFALLAVVTLGAWPLIGRLRGYVSSA